MSNTDNEFLSESTSGSRPGAKLVANKLVRIMREETEAFQPRLLLIQMLTNLIPRYSGARLRTRMLRAMGLRIGHGSIVMGTPFMYGAGNIRDRLEIGRSVVLNVGCTFDLNGPIRIEDDVAIGHEVLLLTSSHHIGTSYHRAGPLFTAPVTIERGAWIGSRSIVLPGVTVGKGSVVGASALVTKDVPPNTLIGGVPARIIRPLAE